MEVDFFSNIKNTAKPNAENNSFSTAGDRHGLYKLHPNVKVVEVDFDMNMVKNIDEKDKPLIANIIEYLCYDVAQDRTEVDINIYVSIDLNDEENVIYYLSMVFHKDVEFDITRIVDQVRTFGLLHIRNDIKMEYNKKMVLTIPINRKPFKVSKIVQTMIHMSGPPPIYTYDNSADDKRANTKRKRDEK